MCCVGCLEKLIEYFNKAAYAFMAVTGQPFFSSAWTGFLLNIKHGLAFAWAKTLANLFVLFGKVTLVVLNCATCFLLMKYITKDVEEGVNITWPIGAVAVSTYITVNIFLSMFDEGVLAMLTCLSIDADLHDGEPKFGPPTFHDKINKIGSIQEFKEKQRTNKLV